MHYFKMRQCIDLSFCLINNEDNNNRHFYSAVYLEIPLRLFARRIYYYPGFSLVAITALQHFNFKELIPARYPFTSPGLSVANVDQCLAKGHDCHGGTRTADLVIDSPATYPLDHDTLSVLSVPEKGNPSWLSNYSRSPNYLFDIKWNIIGRPNFTFFINMTREI